MARSLSNTTSTRLAAGLAPLLVASMIVLTGCGSGNSETSVNLLSGRFVDSPVEGLQYRTGSQEGLTGSGGTFNYMDGESVEFFVGAQSLGQAPARSIVHINDVTAPGYTTPNSAGALRVAQVLQSLDADHNPDNGILIVSESNQWFITPMLDFTADDADFNAAFAGAVAPNRPLVTPAQAQRHIDNYFNIIATEYEAACDVPRDKYQIDSISDTDKTEIDTSDPRFGCQARAQILAYKYSLQPSLSSELGGLISQSAVFVEAGGNEPTFDQAITDDPGKKSAVLGGAKAISILADANDAVLEVIDAKSFVDFSAKVAQIAFGLIDASVASGTLAKSEKEEIRLRNNLASEAISTLAHSSRCATMRKSKKADNECAMAVVGALKLIEPSLGFVVTDKDALLALENLGLAMDLSENLVEANGNPSKLKAAMIVATTEFLRIQGSLILNAKTPDSGWSTFWNESLTQITESFEGFASCKSVLTDLNEIKKCKDATLDRTLENVSKLVFRAGMIWNLSDNLAQIDSIYLVDRLLRDYLAAAGDIRVWYANYGVEDTETSHPCWLLFACKDDALQHERTMFENVLNSLKGKGIWSDPLPIEQTWREFAAERSRLQALASIYMGATLLSLRADIDTGARIAQLTVQGAASRMDGIQCSADGATPSLFNLPNGNGGTQTLSYEKTGVYQISCVGRKDGAAVMTRSVAIAMLQCPDGATLKLGSCVNASVSSVLPTSAVLNQPATFTVTGQNLPLTAVLFIADASCGTPTNRSATSFTVQCTPTGSTGSKVITIKTDTAANGGVVIDSSQSITIDLSAAPLVFYDDFNASYIDIEKWNLHGSPSVNGGFTQYPARSRIDTKDKVTLSGNKIVIEARLAGQGVSRDTSIQFIDVESGDYIYSGDTNYSGWGFFASGSGAYNFIEVERPAGVGALPQNCTALGGSTNKFMEYRWTLEGNKITIERGLTLSNVTQMATRTLGRSIVGRAYYLSIGTASQDYSPGTWDWVRVSTSY